MANNNTTIRIVENANGTTSLDTNIQRVLAKMAYMDSQMELLVKASSLLREEIILATKELGALSLVRDVRDGVLNVSAADGRNLNIKFS